MADIQPDIIGIQEVDLRIDQGNWIRERLNQLRDGLTEDGPYTVYQMAGPRERVVLEALGILTNRPVLRHEGFDYLFRNRVAHRVRIDVDGVSLDFWNTHFHHEVGAEHNAVRVRQAEQLRDWIAERSGGTPTVLVGDLNSLPGTRPLRILGDTLWSAYDIHHGSPPAETISPLHVRSRDLPDLPGPLTIDYILVSAGVEVVSADLAFDKESPADPGIYASDHVGIVARLRV